MKKPTQVAEPASTVAQSPEALPSEALMPYPIAPELLPETTLSEGRYEVSFARNAEQLDEVLRLRFEIFNVELGEGLDESWETRRDRDPFDAVCHHLIVVERASGRIVGTYRMQTTVMAQRNLGLYSSAEFDLSKVPAEIMESAVELGRACVAEDHRNTQVLFLLWKGLALYMSHNRLRFLFGCCSLTSQDPGEGKAVLDYLAEGGHLHPDLTLYPQPGFECYDSSAPPTWDGKVKIPKLFRIYLRHGGKVCGPPAIDREFKTIDYLVLFDVAAMEEKKARAFFG